MIVGSLVCLSPDDFETFFFATVAGRRDPEKLAKGEFTIKLEIESTAMPEITPLITYVMVESQVYFEVFSYQSCNRSMVQFRLMSELFSIFSQAYRHNLKVLQVFGKDNFPLEKYIVDVDRDISPPNHLRDKSVYNFPIYWADDTKAGKAVDILNNQEWPPREDFKLDESQYEAFRAALTKQLAVIQGPPGNIELRTIFRFKYSFYFVFTIQEQAKPTLVCA